MSEAGPEVILPSSGLASLESDEVPTTGLYLPTIGWGPSLLPWTAGTLNCKSSWAPPSLPLVEVNAFIWEFGDVVPFVPTKAFSLCGNFSRYVSFPIIWKFSYWSVLLFSLCFGFFNSKPCSDCPLSETTAGYLFKNYGPSICTNLEQLTF